MKRCCKCKQTLPEVCFGVNNGRKDKLSKLCKACITKEQSVYKTKFNRTKKLVSWYESLLNKKGLKLVHNPYGGGKMTVSIDY
jgi:protein-arginine kinase activator protein McsA